MKGSEHFKKTIEEYLINQAATDEIFDKKFKNPKKNINECINYILSTVKESKINGFTDAEIFGMAIHYYEEDDIKVGDISKMNVVVNHQVQLTQEEVDEQKAKAKEKVFNDAYKKLTSKKKPVKKEVVQTNLF